MVGCKASWERQVYPCPVPTSAWLKSSALKNGLPLAIPKMAQPQRSQQKGVILPHNAGLHRTSQELGYRVDSA